MRDRLLPPAARTALPPVPRRTRLLAPPVRARAASLPYAQLQEYDTGSWSRYSLGGPLSTLEYHVLLRDILGTLCRRKGTPLYCEKEARFTQYLAAPPG